MEIPTFATFTASELKHSGPILDAALQGVVRLTRRGEAFVLLRQSRFEQIIREAADGRPKNLGDLLVDYDATEVKARLSAWNAEAAHGHEPF